MSFGFSVSDIAALTQLALKTAKNCRKACDEHAELTREASGLHLVLRRLEREAVDPKSPINRPGDACREELTSLISGCREILVVLDKILEKYNTLSDEERSVRKLWQKVRFGNGKMADLGDLRSKVNFYASAFSLYLNMVSMRSIGNVEKQMNEAGGDLKEIRLAVNGITAHLMADVNKEGSVLTAYAGDEKAVWREFRRELVRDGFSSSVIRKHKDTIKAYVKELGSRGLLDDPDPSLPDEGSKGVGQISNSTKNNSDCDSASTTSGSMIDALSMKNSTLIRPESTQDGVEVWNEPSHESILVPVSYQSPEQSGDRSESEPGSARMTVIPRDKSHASLGQDCNSNMQIISLDNQLNLVEITQSLPDDVNLGDVAVTVTTDQPQPQDAIPSPGLPLTVKNLQELQVSVGWPTRSSWLRSSQQSDHLWTFPPMIYHTASGMNISLHLSTFQSRVDIILACSPENFDVLAETSSVGCRADGGQIDIWDDLEALKKHTDSCLPLISRMQYCMKHYYDPFEGPDLKRLPSLCEDFLLDAAIRNTKFGPRTVSTKDRANYIHDLLIDIATWSSNFDQANGDIFDRLWLKFSSNSPNVPDHMYFEGADFSVKDVCEDLTSKSADEQLYDIHMILNHGFEDRCNDFLEETPRDIQIRNKVYSTLTEGIMQNVLLRLNAVNIEEDQELRKPWKKIAGKANQLLWSMDQTRIITPTSETGKR